MGRAALRGWGELSAIRSAWREAGRLEEPSRADLELVAAALDLAHTPVRPLRSDHFPDRVTRELLGS